MSPAERVFEFFDAYDDKHETMYATLPALIPPIDQLEEAARELLEFCTVNQMTLGEARRHFLLIKGLETRNPPSLRPVSNQFETPDSFVTYLDRARKWHVRKEGWRTVSIQSEFGVN